MQNKVLNGLVYQICEIYIVNVLMHGKTDPEFHANTPQVFDRLRDKKVAVKLWKTAEFRDGLLILSKEAPEGP
jgi:hypothetical protein